jgi:hypothetical protein
MMGIHMAPSLPVQCRILASVAAIGFSAIIVGCAGGTARSTGGLVTSGQSLDASRAKAKVRVRGEDARSALWTAAERLEPQSMRTQHISQEVKSNIDFSKADCKKLTERELESYIDPRIPAHARALALADMRGQPICQRQNVELMAGADTYANTWEDWKTARPQALTSVGNHVYVDKDGDLTVDTGYFFHGTNLLTQREKANSPPF